ncbi:MAG: maltose operon protein MalM, partial [Pantoea sp.]|nr:maltose operon protein MalM [Pantoea sp.]
MKMTKTLTALCLSAALLAGHSLPALADINLVPQDLSSAPQVAPETLQHLSWLPVAASQTQVTQLATSG